MATTTSPSPPKGEPAQASPAIAARRLQCDAGSPALAMGEFALTSPSIPIPFHRLLKVVALVDREDAQTRAAPGSHRRGEVRGRSERALRSRRLRGRGCGRLHHRDRRRSPGAGAQPGSRRARDRLPDPDLGARGFPPGRRCRGPGRHRRGGRLHLSRPADPDVLRQAGGGEPGQLRHGAAAAVLRRARRATMRRPTSPSTAPDIRADSSTASHPRASSSSSISASRSSATTSATPTSTSATS